MNKINQQNRSRRRENRLTAIRGERVVGLGEGIKQTIKQTAHRHRQQQQGD